MAHALLEWETLEAAQVDEIMLGKKPTPPAAESTDSGDAAGAGKRAAGRGEDDPEVPHLDESDLDLEAADPA